MDELRKYLQSRRKTIEASIVAEQIAGNTIKEQCERTALAEITALQIEFEKENAKVEAIEDIK